MKQSASPASLLMSNVAQSAAPTSQRPTSTSRSWMPRPAYVAMVFVFCLTVGWGAFRLVNLRAPADDDAELADLAELVEEPSGLGQPESSANRARRHSTDESSPEQLPALSGAWLSGTIEIDATSERIDLPRVSQTSARGSDRQSTARPAQQRGPALVPH